MSMTMQLIAAITASRREIDTQIGRLTSFNSEIDQAISQVEAAIGGSTQGYDQQMIAALQRTKSEIAASVRTLEQAKDQLDRVSMI